MNQDLGLRPHDSLSILSESNSISKMSVQSPKDEVHILLYFSKSRFLNFFVKEKICKRQTCNRDKILHNVHKLSQIISFIFYKIPGHIHKAIWNG